MQRLLGNKCLLCHLLVLCSKLKSLQTGQAISSLKVAVHIPKKKTTTTTTTTTKNRTSSQGIKLPYCYSCKISNSFGFYFYGFISLWSIFSLQIILSAFFLLPAIFFGDALNNNENIMGDISEHWLITV